jgi:hypothetical protein
VDATKTKKADKKSAFFIDDDSDFHDRKDGQFKEMSLSKKAYQTYVW